MCICIHIVPRSIFKSFRVLTYSRFFQSSPHLLFVTRNVQAEVKETKQTAIIIINMLPFIFQCCDSFW